MFESSSLQIFIDVLAVIIGLGGVSFLCFTFFYSFVMFYKFLKQNIKYKFVCSKIYFTTILSGCGSVYQMYLAHLYLFSDIPKAPSILDLQFIISYMISWFLVNYLHYNILRNKIYCFKNSKYKM